MKWKNRMSPLEEVINLEPSVILSRMPNGMISIQAENPMGEEFLVFVFNHRDYDGINFLCISDESLREYSEELWSMFKNYDTMIVHPEEEDWIPYCDCDIYEEDDDWLDDDLL